MAAFLWCSSTDPSEVTRVLSLAWPQGRAFTLAWTLSPAPLGSASQLLPVGLTALSHQSKAQSLLADRPSPHDCPGSCALLSPLSFPTKVRLGETG